MQSLADRIKQLRLDRGWSQTDLAEKVGIKQSFIGALEAKNQKSSSWLPEIAHAFGVDAYWLKTGKGVARPWENTQPLPLSTNEPAAPVYAFPNPLLSELAETARKISDTGLHRLIERAEQLAADFPRIHNGNAAR